MLVDNIKPIGWAAMTKVSDYKSIYISMSRNTTVHVCNHNHKIVWQIR